MPIKNILVVHRRPRVPGDTTLYKSFMSFLMKKKGINVSSVIREKLQSKDVKGKDLIIVIGGDGTFLTTSHKVEDELIIGINSDVDTNVGFFATSDKYSCQGCINQILKGKFKVRKLNRIQASIPGHPPVHPALNEVFIGHEKPYLMSRYAIQVKNRQEQQKSSGMLVGSGAGSHAWIKSAGGSPLSLTSKKIQFVAIDPYKDKFSPNKLIKGILPEKSIIKITPLMDNLIMVMDSHTMEYHVKKRQTVTIKQFKPLRQVYF